MVFSLPAYIFPQKERNWYDISATRNVWDNQALALISWSRHVVQPSCLVSAPAKCKTQEVKMESLSHCSLCVKYTHCLLVQDAQWEAYLGSRQKANTFSSSPNSRTQFFTKISPTFAQSHVCLKGFFIVCSHEIFIPNST